jgi:glutathione S-transferase
MILYSTPTSPFGRKVKIAARIHGVMDPLRIEAGDPWSEGSVLRSVNPLGKMPVLVGDDGFAIYDSGVILEFLDTLLDKPRLFPTDRSIETRVRHALGDGLIEAGLLITYERQRRPAEFCYAPWVEHQQGKILRGLKVIAQAPPDPQVADAGAITIACALGYLDWRKQVAWRPEFPILVTWLDSFRSFFPAFDETRHEH